MLERYGKDSPVLHPLRDWYIAECERHGQSTLGTLPAIYDSFDNGERIERGQRLLYRQRLDLRRAFPNPYQVQGSHCYKAWYEAHPTEHLPSGAVNVARGAAMSTALAGVL